MSLRVDPKRYFPLTAMLVTSSRKGEPGTEVSFPFAAANTTISWYCFRWDCSTHRQRQQARSWLQTERPGWSVQG
jgi:hypothetical protein